MKTKAGDDHSDCHASADVTQDGMCSERAVSYLLDGCCSALTVATVSVSLSLESVASESLDDDSKFSCCISRSSKKLLSRSTCRN